MSEEAGWINEPDLMHELTKAMFASHATGDYEVPEYCLGDIIDCQPNLTHRILEGAAIEALKVLRKRGLINTQGLEIMKREGL